MNQANVSNMNGTYGKTYSSDDLQRLTSINNRDAMMGMMTSDGMDAAGMIGGQTLDEIISQNNKEIQRRRSYQQSQSYRSNGPGPEADVRRSSMMEFGPGPPNDMDSFQFEPSPALVSSPLGRGGSIAQRRLDSQRQRRRESAEDIVMNPHFQHLGQTYPPLPQSSPYQQPLDPSRSLNLDVAGTYLPSNLSMGMDFATGNLQQDPGNDITPMNMFSQGSFQPTLTSSPIHQNFSNSLPGPGQDPGGGNSGGLEEQDMMNKLPDMQMSDRVQNMQTSLAHPPMTVSNPNTAGQVHAMPDYEIPSEPQKSNAPPAVIETSRMTFSTGDPLPGTVVQPSIPQYRNAYSSSGFDMLGILMRVAARPKPQINIGAVDMSCAFVVCDVSQHDIPIVYCSDIFERLTGYSKHEILGRNCRFLQAPDGKVQPGIKRKYVDDQAVLHLKNMISQRQEAQISLINYRKGGQPFMNLLTMIPITWDSDEIRYFVGFQVDLVEQPTSITNKNPGESARLTTYRHLSLIKDQMARMRSITSVVCCLDMSFKHQKTTTHRTSKWVKQSAGMRYPRCSARLALVNLNYLNASGIRCCLRTPMMWSMCCP